MKALILLPHLLPSPNYTKRKTKNVSNKKNLCVCTFNKQIFLIQRNIFYTYFRPKRKHKKKSPQWDL